MLVLNLDTNHVSDLVRRLADDDVVAVIRILERGDAYLGLSHFHTAQLGSPSFKEWPELKSMLQSVPHVLLQPRENLYDEEVACAVATATGLTRRPPRVIARDTSEWGYHPGPVGCSAIEMIEFFKEFEEHRLSLIAVESQFVAHSSLKHNAYVVQNPLGPLTLMVRDHLEEFRATTATYGSGLTASEVVTRVGGLAAFPAYEVAHFLTTYVLKHTHVRAKHGDVADEYIASFAPYVAVTVLDGPTTHRLRESRVPCVNRVTKRLADVPSILGRVRAGEITPLPSARVA